MNIFDQYGIKEVADVTIYSIHKKADGSGDVYYVPALYLDTLKVTTAEKSADNTWAMGGLGNSRLISWDYNKQINLTLEDALCTPASLGMCWGGILSSDWKDGQITHQYGIQDATACGGTERVSRLEKAFYPRNDTINATISSLLPRDGSEDILTDWNDDPVYLDRSSVLDGTVVKGFGYVDSHPYKWRAEIETSIKSIAIVPDRFFSIYGKSYPIKRKQTIGINQPSNAFKYEIIYLRGYDKYDDEGTMAKIIYHKQAENNIDHEYVCESDKQALEVLDNFSDYPYLKVRVCRDNSIRTYLGKKEVGWDYTRQIGETVPDHAEENEYWVEVPQINAQQFKDMDLWLRFDSINALSYYLMTKYEENIFAIGPKEIKGGLETYSKVVMLNGVSSIVNDNGSVTLKAGTVIKKAVGGGAPVTVTLDEETVLSGAIHLSVALTDTGETSYNKEQLYNLILQGASTTITTTEQVQSSSNSEQVQSSIVTTVWDLSSVGYSDPDAVPPIVPLNEDGFACVTDIEFTNAKIIRYQKGLTVAQAVGLDYELEDAASTNDNDPCVPCCKKSNLSRSIWAYVNPKTMTPFDDDYWFHQGEPYYKKSLTISTKEAPIKAQKIFVTAGDFPGMYKIVGETYIRNRDTGDDERVQLSLPLCKIKSNQTLNLQADGDPTTFNFEVEVGVPQNGIAMEITFYGVEKEQKLGCNGNMVEKDGSTRVAAK